MPRLAVSLTEPQVRDRTKTVTRRAGWRMLRVGGQLTLCRKVTGRRRGEPLARIADVEVISARGEPLDSITAADVAAVEVQRHRHPCGWPQERVRSEPHELARVISR